MEVIINNCTGVGMRARLCTLYGVYIYARQGRKRRTSVLLRCEKLNHKQRVAHNNKQYSCVLTMMMWHSAELWIGCCSCFCCCWWTMKYTATPDIKPNQNWTKHNCHWEHTIIIEVQRKDGTLRARIHTDRQKTITAAAAASKDKKKYDSTVDEYESSEDYEVRGDGKKKGKDGDKGEEFTCRLRAQCKLNATYFWWFRL